MAHRPRLRRPVAAPDSVGFDMRNRSACAKGGGTEAQKTKTHQGHGRDIGEVNIFWLRPVDLDPPDHLLPEREMRSHAREPVPLAPSARLGHGAVPRERPRAPTHHAECARGESAPASGRAVPISPAYRTVPSAACPTGARQP